MVPPSVLNHRMVNTVSIDFPRASTVLDPGLDQEEDQEKELDTSGARIRCPACIVPDPHFCLLAVRLLSPRSDDSRDRSAQPEDKNCECQQCRMGSRFSRDRWWRIMLFDVAENEACIGSAEAE